MAAPRRLASSSRRVRATTCATGGERAARCARTAAQLSHATCATPTISTARMARIARAAHGGSSRVLGRRPLLLRLEASGGRQGRGAVGAAQPGLGYGAVRLLGGEPG